MSKKNGKARFELHADTLALIEGLGRADYGQVASYSALSELIGRNVQTEARGNLNSALHVLARDYAMFFSCVRSVGLMRVTESEYLATVPKEGRTKIRNIAGRIEKNLSHIPDGKLSREELTAKMTGIGFAGTMREFAREKADVSAPEKPKAAPNPSKKALELFTKKS